MKIEYSYGVMKYFMKYLGGIIFLVMTLLFSVCAVYPIASGLITQQPLKMSLAVLLFTVSSWAGFRSTYYCFHYASLFTMKFLFNDFKVKIYSGDYPTDADKEFLISKVILRKCLFMLEVHFVNDSHKEIILMNNSRTESIKYRKIKEHLLSHPNVVVKWW
jgi:hypothetical protein